MGHMMNDSLSCFLPLCSHSLIEHGHMVSSSFAFLDLRHVPANPACDWSIWPNSISTFGVSLRLWLFPVPPLEPHA